MFGKLPKRGKNTKNIPLFYVIRPSGTDGPPHNGATFQDDNHEVYGILANLCLGGPGEIIIRKHSKSRDDRTTFLDLDNFFMGGGGDFSNRSSKSRS